MIVIGIDPDCQKHGVAYYKNGKLISLDMKETIHLVNDIKNQMADEELICALEDVMSNKFVYKRNENKNKKIQSTIAMNTGRCQQAQVELQRLFDYYKIPYVLYPPQRGNWAKQKEHFERVTGWNKRSNEDSRSAAYFGYLAWGRYGALSQ
ncbi:hypothetical protein [Marinicellulosiphila megalodicopiae]|uniref:hypothetical protein n=1 Tax=Marinicellulosiphila megalodicopiae TaxID=2724896 RepID=UPI003BB1F54C